MAVASTAALNGGWRKWVSAGTGVGVAVMGARLHVVVSRLRPSGVQVAGEAWIENFEQRPAAEWGAELAAFVRRHGAAHVPAVLLLPRTHCTVRMLSLPGVAAKDLASAVAFQIDALHPYDEDAAAHGWASIDSSHHLVAAAESATVSRFGALFAEAGAKLGGITVAAAALYTAARLYRTPPDGAFLTLFPVPGGWEAYGESPSRTIFHGAFEDSSDPALAMVGSELRLEPGTGPLPIEQVLPVPAKAPAEFDLRQSALAYAASLSSALPRFAVSANLLPAAQRYSASRLVYAPTAALGLCLLIAAGILAAQDAYQERRYRARLDGEIARFEKVVRNVAQMDREAAILAERAAVIGRFRRRSRADAELLGELTSLLPPPTWISNFNLSRTQVTLYGEAEQAAPLLKILDGSPLLAGSEFAQMTSRQQQAETFVIRSNREGPGSGEEPR